MAKLVSLGSVEDNKLVLQREHLDRSYVIDKSAGKIEYGQVLAFNSTTGKCVTYDPASADGKEVFTIYTGDTLTEAPTADFEGSVLARNSLVNKEYVKGIDLEKDFEGVQKLYLAGIILEEVN